MHWAFVRLAICLLIGSQVCLVHSSSSQENDMHQHRLNQHVREIRARRERRSALPQTDLQCKPSVTRCTYLTALLDFPPYVMNSTKRGFVFDNIIWFVETVCLDRLSTEDPPTCCMEPRFVKDADEMVALIKNRTVDLAFPIQANVKDKLKDLPNVTFIRAFVAKGCSLIVNTKQCQAESREQLLTSITSQWPILACIILLSGISGVVIWVLEHRGNKNQFPSSFTSGSPEGFWWAVVSLTTVGYGDKTPKTFLGRMFGIIWILVGAIMLSLFTALFTNAMQAALDGTKCQDIDSKDVGVSSRNTETQLVAKQYDANIIKFDSIAEMQKQLNDGVIGRVLVDRNTAFHFLEKLKRNRQIRLIRYIDYPLDYYMVHVHRKSEDLDKPSVPLNLNDTEDNGFDDDPREKVAACGPVLKELSADLVGASKQSAQEQLIPAELQTASMSNEMEGLFSTGSKMTSSILFCLLGVFLSLLLLGILWEFFTKCSSTIQRRRQLKGSPSLHRHSDKGNLIPLNKKFSMMQNFVEMEERLRDLTADIQKMKEEFAGTMSANGDAQKGKYKEWADDDNSGEKRRSFFGMLNGRSKNHETVL